MTPDEFQIQDQSGGEPQTVLYADAGELRVWNEHDRDSFKAEVEWLAGQYSGRAVHYVGAAAVFFDEPADCVRMAMDLQRNVDQLHLRIGIHAGVGALGTAAAAQVALTTASGSIGVSPETYLMVMDDVQADRSGCLVIEEFEDDDLAQVCLTPAPVQGGPDLSTFAGLGRL